MKTILILVLLVSTTSAFAKKRYQLCSVREARKVIPIAEGHSSYDKNRHCTVSCMLALRCNKNEVMLIGILKEIKDLFGPGHAEREDIRADRTGIQLVRNQRARTDRECLDQCDLYYR